MRKYFLSILAIVLAIGFSAFTVVPGNTNKNPDDVYVWHKYNPAGTAELNPLVTYTGTAAAAKIAFGCPDGVTATCAAAYDFEGTSQGIYIQKAPQ
jgi:hypothetical protein